MRKAINIAALIVFIWLLIDTFHILDMILGFILAGTIPGTSMTLPPNVMLVILTTAIVVVIFEIIAHSSESVRRIRRQLIDAVTRFPRNLNRA